METKKDKRSIYESAELIKWGGLLNEFLWTCAGVNKKVLRQCPADYAKYAGSGGTILFTALMAMLSGGYAMYFVFDDVWAAIAFGIFWGLLIFNLDRYIVNTMYSDGLPTISWGEVRSGLPRIIMAVFLGVVISTPLEMKIFSDRIDSQIIKDNARRTAETRKVASGDYETLANLKKEQTKLQQERKKLEDEYHKASDDVKKEGIGQGGGIAGHGPLYQEKREYEDKCKAALDSWDASHETQLLRLENDIKNAQARIDKFEGNISEGNSENGFCVRYEAFSNVTNENVSLEIVSLFIMLLFIVIETAPTFFKMMMSSGPYDDLLRAEMHRVRVLSDKRISDINDEINTEVQISTQKNKERLEAEVLANKKLMEQIATAQAELLQTAIEKWREEELAKINENPLAYIQTTNRT